MKPSATVDTSVPKHLDPRCTAAALVALRFQFLKNTASVCFGTVSRPDTATSRSVLFSLSCPALLPASASHIPLHCAGSGSLSLRPHRLPTLTGSPCDAGRQRASRCRVQWQAAGRPGIHPGCRPAHQPWSAALLMPGGSAPSAAGYSGRPPAFQAARSSTTDALASAGAAVRSCACVRPAHTKTSSLKPMI